MSDHILAAMPRRSNNILQLARLIEADLLQFQSKSTTLWKKRLKALEPLVGLGYGAAWVLGEVDRYETRVHTFFEAYPRGKNVKSLTSFCVLIAEILFENVDSCRRVTTADFNTFCMVALKQWRDEMMQAHKRQAKAIRKVFNALLKRS